MMIKRLALSLAALLLCVVVSIHVAVSAPDISGTWQGTLQTPGSGLRIVLKVDKNASGAWHATLYSIDQTPEPIPVSSVTLNGSTLDLTVDAVQGSYQGTVSADGASITGTWKQGDSSPLNFQRTTAATAWTVLQVHMTQTERATVLGALEKALGDYTFAATIPKLRAAIDANRSVLMQIDNPWEFAHVLTSDLYAVAHDKHLRVDYSPQARPKESPRETKDEIQRFGFMNFGYDSVIRLRGNIGYLKIDAFAAMPQPKSAIDSAMTFLTNTDALIIDLRENGGGHPSSIDYLMGYFFAKPTQLTSILWTKGGERLMKQFSAADVSGPRYVNKPIYVLTSKQTFSGGEQFAYDMKTLKRATLVGMTTGGGANPGGDIPLDDHFAVFIPTGRAVNPYTNTNWEGVGVSPDVPTSAASALIEAYKLALQTATDPIADSAMARKAALADPGTALKASFPELAP